MTRVPETVWPLAEFEALLPEAPPVGQEMNGLSWTAPAIEGSRE